MFARIQRRAITHETRSFGVFTLDLSRARLLREREEVKLRPKSYEVLKFLVENPGRVVSKTELTEAVWPDSFVTDDSLVQCIRDVRRALGDDPPQLIKTVARRGYLFDAEVISNEPPSEKIPGLGRLPDRQGEPVQPDTRGEIVSASASWQRPTGRVVACCALVLVILVSGIVLFKTYRSTKTTSASTFPKVNSIAVLPFKVLNPESKDDYLGLGMADTLITRLSALNQFAVRPTSAIQKYTNSDQDSLAAGREQKVDAVLEGSIQKSADKVRVTVRLLNVLDGRTLWGYKCDEYCADVFEMQDMISATVASALAIKLTDAENQRLSKHYTENTEAYQLYLRGVFLRNQMTSVSLKKSVASFQKAIDIDPHYALAYAGQACSYDALTFMGFIPINEGATKSKELEQKALQLDDSLAEAHAAAAEHELFLEWNTAAAEREFKRTFELNPNEQLANLMYPELLLIQKRVDEAISVSKNALALDPLSPRANKGLAWLLYDVGKYDEAIEQFKKTQELFPNYELINYGPSYEKKGMYDEAVNGYLEAGARLGVPERVITILKQVYATSGWSGFWKRRLELTKQYSRHTHISALEFADLYVHLNDKDAAFHWLEKALEQHEMPLIDLSTDPRWESLHSDQRYTQLLRRIGLPT